MKKKLDIGNITNELAGASLFFTKPAAPPPSPEPIKEVKKEPTSPPVQNDNSSASDTELSKVPESFPPIVEKKAKKEVEKKNNASNIASKHATMTPRYHDTTVSRYQDTTTPQVYGVVIELIRKAVKEFGKEAATHRFTVAEKKEIADLIYTYKNRGIKTSENEIARVAVNFVVEDYKVNGENSVLHKILKALNE